VPIKARRDGYSGDRTTYLDEVRFVVIPDKTAAETALIAGQVDVVTYLQASRMEDMKKRGYNFAAFPVDVAEFDACAKQCAAIHNECGAIDILVNNAGMAIRKPAIDVPMAEWQQVIDLNLTALFMCSRIAARFMRAARKDSPPGGCMVNLASIMGLSGGLFPNASYQASKGGVVNLTRALAIEWAGDRIRVNAVAPTFVNTDFTAQIFSNPAVLEQVEKHTPLGVLPEVDDIAAAILFLASPAARCITGVTLPVDSGYLAR